MTTNAKKVLFLALVTQFSGLTNVEVRIYSRSVKIDMFWA